MRAPTLALFVGLTASASPQDQPMLATVVKKDLPIEVEIGGTFQAENKERVALEPEEYSGDLIVTYLIDEGSPVKKGERLMEFEADNITKAISDQGNDVEDAQSDYGKAVAELEALKIDQEVAMQRVETEMHMAQQAVEGEQQLASYKREEKETAITRKKTSIADQAVNFEQLKQLYDSRDLHTDTETILVEREKKRLEEAEMDLFVLERDYEHFKKYELPVELEKKKLEVLEKNGEKKKQQLKFQAEMAEKEGAVRKAKRALDEANDKIQKLQGDLENLSVAAPRDGIVFYGALNDSQSIANMVVFTSGNVRQNLRIGGRVSTHETLLTVASMEKLSVRMSVLENDIQHMRDGLQITIRPEAFPDLAITGQIDKVDQIASRSDMLFNSVQEFKVKGSYEGVYPQIRAGMNCRVTVHADSVPEAIQVPVIAVFEEEGKYFCYVQDSNKPAKRPIKMGASNGKYVQIVEGLKVDEQVYLYDPLKG